MSTVDPLSADLLTYEEAAVALNGSRRIVEDAIRRGDLTPIRLGARCCRILKADLERYLKRRKST